MNTLDSIMQGKSDKAIGGHGYTVYYDKWFAPIRNEVRVILELGIGGENTHNGGGSLRAWEEYFPNALVYGVDMYDKSSNDTLRIKTFKGSQDDAEFLNDLISRIGNPDIIIDDASHRSPETVNSFKILFPHLKQGGIYVIEDTFCSYWTHYGGSPGLNTNAPVTIMHYMALLSHQMQRLDLAIQQYKPSELVEMIDNISFYRSLIKVEKK